MTTPILGVLFFTFVASFFLASDIFVDVDAFRSSIVEIESLEKNNYTKVLVYIYKNVFALFVETES